MVSNEEFNKREEDHKWRARVEERIVNLQNGDATQNDRLTDQDEELREVKVMLEGQPSDRSDNGMKGDIHDLTVSVNALRAIMQPDSLGEGGVINRLKRLEKRSGIQEKETESRWTFATQVVAATIAAVAVILAALLAIGPVRDSIGVFLESHFIAKATRSTKKGLKRNGSKARRVAAPPAEPADEPASD